MNEKYADYYRIMGLNIAFYRRRKNYSQEQFAEILSISQSHLSKIELARVGISFDKLFAISDALGVAPSKLLEIRD